MSTAPVALHPHGMQSSTQPAPAAEHNDGEWVSVSEAARRIGISRASVQGRVKRGTLECREDNRGNPQVWVQPSMQASAAAPAVTAPEAQQGDSMQPAPAAQHSDVGELQARIAELEATVTGHESVITEQRERILDMQKSTDDLRHAVDQAERREERAWQRQAVLALELAEARAKRRWWFW